MAQVKDKPIKHVIKKSRCKDWTQDEIYFIVLKKGTKDAIIGRGEIVELFGEI